MKLNMPGTFPGSYMATDTAWVTYTPTTVNDKYCGVLRGLWHMKGDMMGGPFVSHARLDEKNNRVVVVEASYSPQRRISAILSVVSNLHCILCACLVNLKKHRWRNWMFLKRNNKIMIYSRDGINHKS